MTAGSDTSDQRNDRGSDHGHGLGSSELIILMSSTMALMAVAIDMMLPAFDEMREAFGLGADSPQIGQIITVYFAGVAVGQLVWGPLADRYGRKPILLMGISVYIVGAVASAMAPSLGVLLVARLVWGLGAAAPRVVSTAIIRDTFEGTAMAKAMSQVMAVFMVVPIFAPVLGAGIVALAPWRAVFWVCAVLSVVLAFWSTRLSETLDPAHRREVSVAQMRAGLVRVLRTPATAGYTLASCFIQGVMTFYLTTSELLVGEVYDRPELFPVVFGAVAIFFAAGAVLNSRIVERLGIETIMTRTLVLLLGAAGVLAAVTLIPDGRPNMVLFFGLLGLSLASFMALTPNLNTVAMQPMADMAGTASSLISAARLGAGATIGAILTGAVGGSQDGFVVGVLVLLSLAAASVLVTNRVIARA